MVLVCVSHFAGVYLIAAGAPRPAVWLATIGMMATPTFIVVSGLLIGYLSDAYRFHLDSYRTKLRDRGLFLLIIGHLWLALTDSLHAGGVTMGLKRGYITDVIGVALLVMVPLARQTPWRMRIKAGLGLALLSSLAALAWHPAGKWMGTLEETLIGSSVEPLRGYAFPLLPWLGVYAASTGLGSRLVPLFRAGRHREAGRFIIGAGLCATGLAIILRVLVLLLPRSGGSVLAALHFLTTPWSKIPPSPGYLLFFGGLGLVITGGLLTCSAAVQRSLLVRALTLLGRNSLWAYLAQNVVYFVVLYMLALPYHPAWPLLLVASIGVVFALAWVWEISGGNKFVTVGYPAMQHAVRTLFRVRNASA